MKSKKEFIDQCHTRSFESWWLTNESLFPLVHTKDAKHIYTSARFEFENNFMKNKLKISKLETQLKNAQSRFDKLKMEKIK